MTRVHGTIITAGAAAIVAAGCGAVSQPLPDEEERAAIEWKAHAMDRPHPPLVAPTTLLIGAPPPRDAVILFDGTDLSGWASSNGGEPQWAVGDGYFEVVPGTGALRSRESFGDVQLHIEFASPSPAAGSGQDRGNSGVFLMGMYEVQVLDSYDNETYADGQAAAIYGQHPPRMNASRPPGEWQSYDIYFRRPRFAADGALVEPARMTVLHNGIVVQNNEELRGPTSWLRFLAYGPHADALPIELQDHGARVRYRNVWALPLPEPAEPDAAYAARDRAVQLSAEQLERFVGIYDRPGADAPITITREGGRLFADFFWRPGALELVAVGDAEFVMLETDGRVVFEVDEQGQPSTLVFHLGGAAMPAHRRDG